MLKVKKISKKDIPIPMITSIQSEVSLSNFSALTPKSSCTFLGLNKQNLCEDNEKQKYDNPSNQNNSLISNRSNNSSISSIISKTNNACLSNVHTRQPCVNHKQKQSYYYLQDNGYGQPTYYCSKCSIMLASKGFIVKKIQKLEYNQAYKSSISVLGQSERLSMKSLKQRSRKRQIKKQQEQRSSELTLFLNKVQRNHSRLIQFSQKLEFKKYEVYQMSQVLTSKISENFSFLHQIIEIQQQNCLQYIEKMCKQLQQIHNHPKKFLIQTKQLQSNMNFKEMMETLQNMKVDICQSYEDIVQNASNQQYQVVMNHYTQNISQIQLFLTNQYDIMEQIKCKSLNLREIGQKICSIIELQNTLANFFENFHQHICEKIQAF